MLTDPGGVVRRFEWTTAIKRPSARGHQRATGKSCGCLVHRVAPRPAPRHWQRAIARSPGRIPGPVKQTSKHRHLTQDVRRFKRVMAQGRRGRRIAWGVSAFVGLMVRQECMEAFRSASMKSLSGRQKNTVAPSYETAGGRQDARPVGQDRCRDTRTKSRVRSENGRHSRTRRCEWTTAQS
jgi:hypothetical protein